MKSKKEKKLKDRHERVKIKLRKKRECLREEKRIKYELEKIQYENREKMEPIVNEKESEESPEVIT